jgi:hypothetical protein
MRKRGNVSLRASAGSNEATRVHNASRSANMPDRGAGGTAEPGFERQSVICFRPPSPQQAGGTSPPELRPD